MIKEKTCEYLTCFIDGFPILIREFCTDSYIDDNQSCQSVVLL